MFIEISKTGGILTSAKIKVIITANNGSKYHISIPAGELYSRVMNNESIIEELETVQ